MNRYADPTRCPDCGQPITFGANRCTECGLSLEGPYAAQLFEVLTEADRLLAAMRAGVPVAATTQPAASPRATGAAPAAVKRARSRLAGASVPAILLGLGALCVLVAALVFVAVAWSVMGVAGRTTTLAVVTVVAGVLTGVVASRGLRAASESLSVITFGLLALDLAGARTSGWLGTMSLSTFVIVLGLLLAAVGALAATQARRAPVPALISAEVVLALGGGLVATGLVASHLSRSVGLLAAFVACAVTAAVARSLQLRAAFVGAGGLTVLSYAMLVVHGLDRAFTHPTFTGLWGHAHAWPLAVSLAVAAGAAVAPIRLGARVLAGSIAVALAACLALAPALPLSSTGLTLVILAVLAVVTASTWAMHSPWRHLATLTQIVGLLSIAPWTAARLSTAAHRFADSGFTDGITEGRWQIGAGDLLPAPGGDDWAGVVLVLAMAIGLCATHALLRSFRPRHLGPFGLGHAGLIGAATVAGGAAIAAVTLYPVPVALVVTLLLIATAAFTVAALGTRTVLPLAPATVFALAAVWQSGHASLLCAAALTVVSVCLASVWVRCIQVDVAGAAGLPLACVAAGAVWCWSDLAGLDRAPAAAVVVILCGLALLGGRLVLRRLRADLGTALVPLEAGAALSFTAAALGGVTAPYADASAWASIYLTLGGMFAAATALVWSDRRLVGWVGGALLTAATWIRLWDTGIRTPEAYTLPAAVALLVVGVVAMRRRPGTGSISALSTGLLLALVPSLLWVLREPVTVRAVLLGLGCALVLAAGLRLRWAAPVLYGSVVGALLVVRLSAPYVDAAMPRWVLIGAAGAVLIGLGATWERRLQEVHQITDRVKDLR